MIASEIIDTILKLGSVSGLVSLLYLIFQNLRKRPKFKLDFHGSTGEHFEKDGMRFYRHSFSGVLKNQSLDPNTVTRLYLAVWGNKKKSSTLRFGHGGVTLTDKSDDKEIKLPVHFGPREAKHLAIVFEFPSEGTADERLLKEFKEVKPGSGMFLPKHKYEICAEDVSENLFDATGSQINRDEIGLRWTLPNTIRELQQGDIKPFIKHVYKIFLTKSTFRFKVIMQALGLWK